MQNCNGRASFNLNHNYDHNELRQPSVMLDREPNNRGGGKSHQPHKFIKSNDSLFIEIRGFTATHAHTMLCWHFNREQSRFHKILSNEYLVKKVTVSYTMWNKNKSAMCRRVRFAVSFVHTHTEKIFGHFCDLELLASTTLTHFFGLIQIN